MCGNLFEIEIFCNIIKVLAATFDQCLASLLNESTVCKSLCQT